MALPLHQIDGHHEIEPGERVVEARALRSAEYRVAAVADQRLDLSLSGGGDLIGEFGEAAGTGDRR